MTRRDGLKLIGAAGVAACVPITGVAAAARGPTLIVFDGRFDAGRRFALAGSRTQDCAADAAALWYRSLVAAIGAGDAIEGLTTPADAMVIADCARRSGAKLVASAVACPDGRLMRWSLRSVS